MIEEIDNFEFQFSGLESVTIGRDAAQTLVKKLEVLQADRVFVLASKTVNSKSGVIARLQDQLGARLAGVFTDIHAHTPRVDVLQAVAQARDAAADLLVAIGGGSIIDATKAVQLALELDIHSESQLLEFAQFADGSRGAKAGDYSLFTPDAKIRQIAIPTTLSGAEHSNNAGVTDTVKGLKEGYRAPSLYPRHIIYDPALSLHTPQWLWLSTAIRSLDHAIEGYCSRDVTPYLEGHFLHAMRLFSISLPEVHRDPNNLQARSLNQQAVWLACCALGKVAHGASHGIGYLLGAVCGVPHGYTSCVMLPAVLRWNYQVNALRQAAVASALGRSDGDAATAVSQLVAGLGLPVSLRDVGVRYEQLEKIAQLASRHPVVRRNPRAVSSADDVMAMLELAW